MNIDKDLEEILGRAVTHGHIDGINKVADPSLPRCKKFAEIIRKDAVNLIKQVALEVGTMFLQDLGEDDKIEAWKKHVNNGVQ